MASRVGPYRLDDLLGVGGMGEVWRASDTEHDGRPVAVKLLRSQLARRPEFAERFRREARLAASLRHPNVIPILRYGEEDGRLYLAMQLVEGIDLSEMVAREGPLGAARAVAIVTQVADVLDAAHGAGLLHRDVKPTNVRVLGPRDFVYLLDFGIARPADADDGLTETGQALGTVAYMAPERFTTGPIDRRVDVYSLAALLHATLTGRPPFDTADLARAAWAHQTVPPPMPSATDPALAPFDPVIARGLAKNPDERPPTAGALAAEAAEAAGTAGFVWPAGTGQTVAATGPVLITPKEPVQDRPAAPAGIGGPGTGGPGTGGPGSLGTGAPSGPVPNGPPPGGSWAGAFWPGGPSSGGPSGPVDGALSDRSFPTALPPAQSGRPRGSWFRRHRLLAGTIVGFCALLVAGGVVTAVVLSGSGSTTGPSPASGPVVAPATQAARSVVKIPVGTNPFPNVVSPNGRFVYVANQNGSSVSVVDTTTTRVAATVPAGASPSSLAISPDGATVWTTVENGVVAIDTATNTVRATHAVGDRPVDVAVTPDGQRLEVAEPHAGRIDELDAATLAPVRTLTAPPPPGASGETISADGTLLALGSSTSPVLTLIDLTTGASRGQIPLPLTTIVPRFSPDGRSVLVTDTKGPTAAVVDVASSAVSVGRLPGQSAGAIYAPDLPVAYAHVDDLSHDPSKGQLLTLDPQTLRVLGSIPAPTVNSADIAVSPDGSRVYVVDQVSAQLLVVALR